MRLRQRIEELETQLANEVARGAVYRQRIKELTAPLGRHHSDAMTDRPYLVTWNPVTRTLDRHAVPPVPHQ